MPLGVQVEEPPFEAALREVHGRLLAAHTAAVGTLEGELQRMRFENTTLRMRLAEAGLSADVKLGDEPAGARRLDAAASLGAAHVGKRASTTTRPSTAGVAASAWGGGHPAALGTATPASAATTTNTTALGAVDAILVTEVATASTIAAVVGSEVELKGLSGRCELNGKRGSVTGYDHGSGRFEVQIDGPAEERVRCRPEHLVFQVDRTTPSTAPVGLGSRAPAEVQGEPDIIEVCTPAAEAAARAVRETPASLGATGAADMEVALKAVLTHYGLQDLAIQQQFGGKWTVAGISFLLRHGSGPVSAGGPPYQLLASCDGGNTWEALQALIHQHRQHGHLASQHISAPASAVDPSADHIPRSGCKDTSTSLPDLTRRPVWRSPSPLQSHVANSHEEQQGQLPFGRPQAPQQNGLPAWRADGMPSFNDAFPAAFDANSGASQYYSQFRVRVPLSSQYDQQQ